MVLYVFRCLTLSFSAFFGAIFRAIEIAPANDPTLCAFLKILKITGGRKKTCKRSNLQVIGFSRHFVRFWQL